MVLTSEPHVCTEGYESTDTREPQDTSDRPMNPKAVCTEPQAQSNARGGQHAPRAGAAYRAPVVAAYDARTGQVQYTDESPSDAISYTGGAASVFGEESWKWLLLQPLGQPQE
jgi:phospholipid/cholesterol/gamma-HCH transport system substrate-binding protein